ncbi:MAG: ATP-binding protein [bacterium]
MRFNPVGTINAVKPLRNEIIEVRSRILNRILIFCLLPGIFPLMVGAYQAYSQGRWGYSIIYSVVFLSFLFSLVFINRVSYHVRAIALSSGLYLLAAAVLSRIGLSGLGMELMFLCCFTVAMLFNLRAGFTLIAIGVATVAAVGLGMIHDIIEIHPDHMLTSHSGLAWLTATVFFFLGARLVTLAPQMLRSRLEASLDLAEKQAESLQTANRQLREEIEKREGAEAEQLRLRRLLQDTIDSMPSVLIAIDKTYHITLWNQEITGITGVSAEKARGQLLADLLPPLAAQYPLIQDAMQRQQPQKTEKIQIRLSDDYLFIDCIVYPIASNGEQGAVIRIDNVTERVRMEEVLIQTEKMMSLGGLAAGMAHEINNPLGGILQAAQNIERRFSPAMEPNRDAAKKAGINLDDLQIYLQERKIITFIQGIKTAGQRAASIISNMLLFSRRSQSKSAEVNLPSLLDNTVELARSDYNLKKHFDFKHIAITQAYDPQLQSLWCTETEIEQVVLNLLKNAAQSFMGPDRREEPRITIRTFKEGDLARIEIEDNGSGMDDKTRRKIFEPFFTTKPAGRGTGLGLWVSYMIVTSNHKGTIEVKSEPGRGSLFTLRLPIYAQQQQTPDSKS